MSLYKFLNYSISKSTSTTNIIIKNKLGNVSVQERSFRKSYAKILKVMKVRREIAGPDKVRRRNEWDNWNYKSELYAFPIRLQENMSEETLRCVFIHDSYIQMEERKRRELEIPTQDVQLQMQSNAHLVALGQEIMSSYTKRYLENCFKKIPDEGIKALHNYLLSDEVLADVSSNIGSKDLIFSDEYPPGVSTLALSLKAVIGGIATDNNVQRAENFVLDFICPQLVGKDVFDIWELENPVTVLNTILKQHGHEECEARLVSESGRNTILAIYNVGLYSNKQFLGQGPGETLSMAEEMAAYDALRRIFHIKDCEQPIYFGEVARAQKFKPYPHENMDKWRSDTFNVDLSL